MMTKCYNKPNITVFNLSIFKPCQSYLCPFENRIQEWFPTMESAKFRAMALDPYGIMKKIHMRTEKKGPDHVISIGCQMKNLASNFEYLLLLCFLTEAKFLNFETASRYNKGALTQKR